MVSVNLFSNFQKTLTSLRNVFTTSTPIPSDSDAETLPSDSEDGDEHCTFSEPGDAPVVARFVVENPYYPRHTIMVDGQRFQKEHSGRFKGCWLHPDLEVFTTPEGDVFLRSTYIYQVKEESLVIGGVTTRFLNRHAGGERVVETVDFMIGDELFEKIDLWLTEDETKSGSREIDLSDCEGAWRKGYCELRLDG